MRVLIFALFALAVNAHNYGWSSYGGSPSYSYAYAPSYGGGYGSSLYGASYGSGSGWGSGYGSGSWGGSGRSYISSYSPATRYTYQQPQSVKTAYQTEYTSEEVPGSITTSLGDTGTSAILGYQEWKAPAAVSRHSYQQPHSTGAVYESGYSSGAAPGNIAFTLGGTGYQTGGTAGLTGYQEWKAPAAVSRPATVYRQRTATIHRGGSHGAVAPAKISFTQDFSGVAGLHRSGGSAGISATHRTIAPAAVITEKHSYQQPRSTGAVYQSGYSSGAAPGKIFFTLGGAGYQSGDAAGGAAGGASGVSGYEQWKAPVAVSRPAAVYRQRTATVQRGGYQGAVAPAKISFTQDFSRVAGLQRSGGSAGISTHRTIGPAAITTARRTYTRPQSTGAVYQSGHSSGVAPGSISFTLGGAGYQTGTLGVSGYQEWKAPVAVSRPAAVVSHRTSSIRRTGDQSATGGVAPAKISFVQDFSRVSGQSAGPYKSGVSTFKQAIAPAAVVTENVRYGSTGAIRQSGVLGGIAARPQIRYTQGVSRITAPQVSTVAHQTSGQGYAGVGPAKITFTQDFSAVSGHQGSVKPAVVSSPVSGGYLGGISDSVGYHQGGYQTNVISAPKPAYRAPKQPAVVARQPAAITTVYEPSRGQDQVIDYKQEIVTVDGGQYYVPGSEAKSGTYKEHVSDAGFGGAGYQGGVTNKFVVVPIETYETGKSVYSSGGSQNIGGYSSVSAPFKSHYTSSDPGYSQVSGESPRYGFSQDKSLLYSYSSPNIVSPFSYTYSSGKGQYEKKAA